MTAAALQSPWVDDYYKYGLYPSTGDKPPSIETIFKNHTSNNTVSQNNLRIKSPNWNFPQEEV